jgi:GTP cyclohydrolase II
MSFAPDILERIARARADLRMGVPVILTGSGRALLVCAAETLSEERLADFKSLSREQVLVITSWRAQTLKAAAYDGDVARVRMPSDSTLRWIHCMADPADDLAMPMKGPLHVLRDGPADMHRTAIALTKSAQLLPAAMVQELENAGDFALEHGLTVVPAALADTHMAAAHQMDSVIHARLPIRAADAGRLHIFRPDDGGEEHYAIEIGKPSRDKPVLARLHSACFTGDVLGSLKCDCGPQLNAALMQMGSEGAGVLLYLNQEGRGIGLANKMRAYGLQDQGFDTVEANHRLGFEDDERDFRIGASILKKMGFSAVRLLTNNPKKIAMMENEGIDVSERVPLKVGENAFNTAYLATKAAKSGHLL